MLGGAVAVGAALRLYAILDQLVVSDEWHGPHAAALSSYGELAHLLTIGATSIPMNLYYKLLLDTVGWSELALRLPSLVAGIASLVLFPLWLRHAFAPRVVMLFAWLLAISPFLVFYSRYSRPYALVVLLTFTAIVAGWRWARSGSLRYAVGFALAGAAAAYLHAVEIRVLVGIGILLAIAPREPRVEGAAPAPRLTFLLFTTLGACLLVAALYLPALLNAGEYLTVVAGEGRPGLATLAASLELLCGSADPVAIGLFTGLAGLGFVTIVYRERLLAMLVIGTVLGCLASVYVARPTDSHVPIVFARYVIPVVPLLALAAACGLDALLKLAESRLRSGRNAMTAAALGSTAAALVAALFWLGPLPDLYGATNSFTNHKSYHVSYRPSHAGNAYLNQMRYWNQAALLAYAPAGEVEVRVPEFYSRLGSDLDCYAVIEFPMPLGDVVSNHYLYQRVHRKRVLGGYLSSPASAHGRVRPGVVFPDWGVGLVLGEVRDRSRLHFRNLVDLSDLGAVLDSGARYLILHPKLITDLPSGFVLEPGLDRIRRLYTSTFGDPIFADESLIVFDLRGSLGK